MLKSAANSNVGGKRVNRSRRSATIWLALLGLIAVALPFGSGCDEEQIRELSAAVRGAADDLDPWTKFCLLNTDAEDFAACEAGHVE
ncbi:MAG TPA: hypothetical protein P5081_04485 [Phycisphaerae bacterium]|nr:hypothetical protein [Phycisphaerae bacterium]HRW52119.1 hypothetical protein [Phycisphaerae bacterium]